MNEQPIHPERYAEQLDQWIDELLFAQQPTHAIKNDDALLLRHLLEKAKESTPATGFVDGLAASIAMEKHLRSASGRVWLFNRKRWRRIALSAASLLFFLGIGLLIAPQTRAALLEMINGMWIVDGKALRQAPIEPLLPHIDQTLPPRSLRQLVEQAPFVLRIPGQLPDDLIYANGYVDLKKEGETVSLLYMPKRTVESGEPIPLDTALLFLVIQRGKQATQPILDARYVEPVQINRHPALYAKGGWQKAAADSTGVVWDTAVDANWLTWLDGELTYWLQADGLQLDKNAMIAIAESFVEAKP